jgi:predicted NBD/HSP70 family sugar kinase/predicted transcriptional regulator
MKFITLENAKKSVRHQSLIKESNIKQIFDLILNNEGISRIEISKKTNLSRSTVSLLVDELINAGLVIMTGEKGTDGSGRKPIGLAVNSARAQTITLALRKELYIYTLYDFNQHEIDSFSRKIQYKKGCGEKIWKAICAKSPLLNTDMLLAVCVSIPAKINNDNSLSLSLLDIEEGCNLLDELKSMQSELPLVAGNESSAYVYGEYKCTFHEKVNDLIYFNIDDGVAAGIIINGKVFTGEIGHMSIDPKGPLCSCGKRGCLENMIKMDYSVIRKALKHKDPEINSTARRLAKKVAFGISNVICMFNPEKIVIGGGIEELGDVFLDLILKNIEIPGAEGVYLNEIGRISYAEPGNKNDSLGVLHYFFDNLLAITTEIGQGIYSWN